MIKFPKKKKLTEREKVREREFYVILCACAIFICVSFKEFLYEGINGRLSSYWCQQQPNYDNRSRRTIKFA